jgi:hypothetical protein
MHLDNSKKVAKQKFNPKFLEVRSDLSSNVKVKKYFTHQVEPTKINYFDNWDHCQQTCSFSTTKIE